MDIFDSFFMNYRGSLVEERMVKLNIIKSFLLGGV